MSKPADPDCLHCVIVAAIETYYEFHGERQGGAVILEMSEILATLGEVSGQFVYEAETRAARRQFERYARECLEAGFECARTGKPQTVDTGPQEVEH